MTDTIIIVRNYGRKEIRNAGPEFKNPEYTVWHVTYETSTLDELKKEECSKLKEELKKHIEAGEERWAFKLDYTKHKEYLERRIAILEKKDATCAEVSSTLVEACCVPVPEGMDTDEFKAILERVWHVGYSRGYDEGRA